MRGIFFTSGLTPWQQIGVVILTMTLVFFYQTTVFVLWLLCYHTLGFPEPRAVALAVVGASAEFVLVFMITRTLKPIPALLSVIGCGVTLLASGMEARGYPNLVWFLILGAGMFLTLRSISPLGKLVPHKST